MKDAAILDPSKLASSSGAAGMYRIFSSSGLRSIISTYARLFIMHLLYYKPEGLTCSMIYGLYKKDISHLDISEDLTISRSNIIDLLSDFEVEDLIMKGPFKQYILTKKGKMVFNFVEKLALEIVGNPGLTAQHV